MPKINVYLPQELYDWVRDNKISQSVELQERIRQLRDGEAEPLAIAEGTTPHITARIVRVRSLPVDRGKVRLLPSQTIISADYDVDGKPVSVLVTE